MSLLVDFIIIPLFVILYILCKLYQMYKRKRTSNDYNYYEKFDIMKEQMFFEGVSTMREMYPKNGRVILHVDMNCFRIC